VAVATPQGLLVPVVRAADTLSLAALAARTRELAAKAREKKLEPGDLEGGSFTISNMGMYGITAFTPIINLPQAAILGVCAVEESLVLVGGSVTARKLMGLSLTFDHRVLDGAEAALFLKGIKDALENPLMVLV
jgi:pyruvate dehydrogenase E2 component (dihydrolipoamide acetyltransferase)